MSLLIYYNKVDKCVKEFQIFTIGKLVIEKTIKRYLRVFMD